jgi:hypothetical protein
MQYQVAMASLLLHITLCIFMTASPGDETNPAIIDIGFIIFACVESSQQFLTGEIMELFAALNLEPIFQLTFLGLIVIAGPAVVFVLAFRGGDL